MRGEIESWDDTEWFDPEQGGGGTIRPSQSVAENLNRRPGPGARFMSELGRWDGRTVEQRERDVQAHRLRIDHCRRQGLLYEERLDEPHHRERG